MIDVTGRMIRTMKWWINNVDKSNNDIRKGNPRLTIETDASFKGWGASCEGDSTGGPFIASEITEFENINVLELKAIQFGILAYQEKIIRAGHILVKTDNTTAVAYIRNMGGIKGSCNQVAFEIWSWCKSNGVWLTATYIPGVENIIADVESRNINDRTEWMLDVKVFRILNNMWGPVDIDLFASRTNAQINRYIAWKPDPFAVAIDAFTIDWHMYSFYAFPPFSMIGACLEKVEADKATGIIICPVWPTQHWFPIVMSMLIEDPVLLRKSSKLLKLPHKLDQIHPLYPKLRTMACLISGIHTKTRAYQQGLSALSWNHGGPLRGNNTAPLLKDGQSFVLKGKLVKLHRL